MAGNHSRYTARWVLTATDSAPIEHGALLVDPSGTIAQVGPAARVTAGPDTREIELGDAILLPGLVNTHAHPELTAFRGLLEDLPFHDWIARLLAIKLRASLTIDEWRASALLGSLEAAAAGITTIAATEDSTASVHALREVGLRGVVFREVFGPAPAQARAALADLRSKVDALRVEQTDLVRVGVSPHAPFTVSDALFAATAEYAREEQLPIAVHAAESRAEEAFVRHASGPFAARLRARGIEVERRGRSTIALLARLGVLDARPLLVHCVRVDAQDIASIARHGASVAHCPVANARLGHGAAPIDELLDAGITVGLGSDSVASNNRMDILEEARQTQLLLRARRRRPSALPAERLFRMATLDGARSLRLDDRIGSLEVGKDADLCAVSLRAPHVRPVHDALTTLIHSARASDVVLTVVRGRVIYRDGAFSSVDFDAVRADVDRVAARLRASLGEERGSQPVEAQASSDSAIR